MSNHEKFSHRKGMADVCLVSWRMYLCMVSVCLSYCKLPKCCACSKPYPDSTAIIVGIACTWPVSAPIFTGRELPTSLSCLCLCTKYIKMCHDCSVTKCMENHEFIKHCLVLFGIWEINKKNTMYFRCISVCCGSQVKTWVTEPQCSSVWGGEGQIIELLLGGQSLQK